MIYNQLSSVIYLCTRFLQLQRFSMTLNVNKKKKGRKKGNHYSLKFGPHISIKKDVLIPIKRLKNVWMLIHLIFYSRYNKKGW